MKSALTAPCTTKAGVPLHLPTIPRQNVHLSTTGNNSSNVSQPGILPVRLQASLQNPGNICFNGDQCDKRAVFCRYISWPDCKIPVRDWSTTLAPVRSQSSGNISFNVDQTEYRAIIYKPAYKIPMRDWSTTTLAHDWVTLE